MNWRDPFYPGDDLIDAANEAIDLRVENEALRSIVRKLVIEPVGSLPSYYCAGWLDVNDTEDAAIRAILEEEGDQ